MKIFLLCVAPAAAAFMWSLWWLLLYGPIAAILIVQAAGAIRATLDLLADE